MLKDGSSCCNTTVFWLLGQRGTQAHDALIGVGLRQRFAGANVTGSILRCVGALRSLAIAVAAIGWSASSFAAETPSGAEGVYASAPPRLLQIRTLVTGAGQRASSGSGFLVSADGLAITNYHVVSDVALEPKTYRLEYTAADGSHGDVTLLAVDLANDLALVRVDKHDAPFFSFDQKALDGRLPKGERLYSLGNPLDLGFTITEGTYNGLVEHSYNDRIHFTGALNPGMSGGPAVTAQGSVVGINVATRRGGQLISFLVPARFADALLKRAHDQAPGADLRKEVIRQLGEWRSVLYKSLTDEGFRSSVLGAYQAPEPRASWFDCWSQTNAGASPAPRAGINSINCQSDTSVFVASDLTIGAIQISHSYVKSVDLNQFQFATRLMDLAQPRLAVGGSFRKWYTPQRCQEDFIQTTARADGAGAAGNNGSIAISLKPPPLRVMWCAHGYREFEGLYDTVVVAVTQDHADQALVSRMSLQAIHYDDALKLTQGFLDQLQVSR